MTDPGTLTASPSDPTESLGAEIGAMLGEGDWGGTAGPSSSDAAGDTPAERQDTPAGQPGSEGATEDERAGTPPADATEKTPDSSTPASPDADEDLLAGAIPLAYTVNGDSRTFDGIQVLKDNAGAIVSPEALQLLTRRLGERDHLFEQDQARGKRLNDLEKLTEWRTKDGQGREVVFSGAQGIEMRELGTRLLQAENSELRSIFDRSPAELLAQDDQGNIVWNREFFDNWTKRLELTKENAFHRGKSEFASVAQRVTAPPPPPTTLTAEETKQLAPEAVKYVLSQLPGVTLTPENQTWLASVAENFLRRATPADLQANPELTLGQPIVDDVRFKPIVQGVAERQAQTAKIVSTTVEADRRNTAKLAQAALGRRPNQSPATPVKSTDPAEMSREDRSAQLWERSERAAAGLTRRT